MVANVNNNNVAGIDSNKEKSKEGLWVKASKAIVYAGKRISYAAKVLFIIIRDYQGNNEYAWPSVATLARDMDCSIRYVQALLKELVSAGAIEIQKQEGWVNQYRTCFVELSMTETAKQPMHDSSPFPMHDSSPKLEPIELNNNVCEAPLEKEIILDAKPIKSSNNINSTQEVSKLYQEAGVFEQVANTLALLKPDLSFAKSLVVRSREKWVHNPAGVIVYFGSQCQLPVGKPTKPTKSSEDGNNSRKDYKHAKAYLATASNVAQNDVLKDSTVSTQQEPTIIKKSRVWINDNGCIRPAKTWESYTQAQVVPDPYLAVQQEVVICK